MFEETSVDTNEENSTRVQKNTAADLRIRGQCVLCCKTTKENAACV